MCVRMHNFRVEEKKQNDLGSPAVGPVHANWSNWVNVVECLEGAWKNAQYSLQYAEDI